MSEDFEEVDTDQFPFGNACNHCALKGTSCYDRTDLDCHGDSRPDGRDIVFVKRKLPTLNATKPEVGGIPVGKPHSCDPSKRSYHGGSDVSTLNATTEGE